MALDVATLKKDFPMLVSSPEFAYLDNAATTQTPEPVLTAMDAYYRTFRANVHRGLYGASLRATEAYEGARRAVATFVNAAPEEVMFTSGATAGMNMLVDMLEHSDVIREGDRIVTTALEHHALLLPFREMAKRKGCVLAVAPLRADYSLDEDALEALITEETKLVGITLASNVLGTMPDIGRVAMRAHRVGARVIVDAAKAVGHMPIDVRAHGCDFLFFSGHKMCGPTGIGVLYGKRELLDALKPGSFGGGIVASVHKDDIRYLPPPHRFEAGTPPIAEAIGLAEAVRYLSSVGLESIRAHEETLVAEAIKTLTAEEGVRVFAALPEHNAGVVSFSMEGIHPHDVADILGRHGVAVRAGHHCAIPLMDELCVNAVVRASFFLYNTVDDVNRLAEGVREVRSIFKR